MGLFDLLRRSPRAAADATDLSPDALARRAKAAGQALSATIYRLGADRFIVTAMMYRPGSFMRECGEPTVLEPGASDAELGRTVIAHLLAHQTREPKGGDTRLADWAAYRVSGEKSGRQFRDKALFMLVTTDGVATEISASRYADQQNFVRREPPLDPEGLGRAVREAFDSIANGS